MYSQLAVWIERAYIFLNDVGSDEDVYSTCFCTVNRETKCMCRRSKASKGEFHMSQV